eukprot:TRINITY_DN351_c0_g1::TRINITY_DN351_c0_g1_i1::g.7468::m.7468 TRINITY_DN351_c0_g1::TRINITY_DN351_c0_g1_i1::g.7468  ORF type:complete len:124 (+),score=11.60,FA_synthesis/PF02504.10/0.098 TRINITY_DN351_c0_g1_i1:45-374(+)
MASRLATKTPTSTKLKVALFNALSEENSNLPIHKVVKRFWQTENIGFYGFVLCFVPPVIALMPGLWGQFNPENLHNDVRRRMDAGYVPPHLRRQRSFEDYNKIFTETEQ